MAGVKVSPNMVLEWIKTVKELKNTMRSKNRGFPDSKRQIYLLIADRYNIGLETVYRYMSPPVLKRMHDYEYRNRPEIRIQKRDLDYRYKRLIRHIDTLLPQVFNSKPELPLKEISAGIENLAGISLKERTLEKILGKYEGKPKGLPILKTESGNYQLNHSFYNS